MTTQGASDWIQERAAARARELGMSAYAIAKASDKAVSEQAVCDFLKGRNSMTSRKLAAVLRVLGLDLAPAA